MHQQSNIKNNREYSKIQLIEPDLDGKNKITTNYILGQQNNPVVIVDSRQTIGANSNAEEV